MNNGNSQKIAILRAELARFEALANAPRPAGFVSRLPGLDPEENRKLAERVRAQIEELLK